MPAQLFYESQNLQTTRAKILLDGGPETLGWFLARIFTWAQEIISSARLRCAFAESGDFINEVRPLVFYVQRSRL